MKISDYFLEYNELYNINNLNKIWKNKTKFKDDFNQNFNILNSDIYDNIDEFDFTNIEWKELSNLNNYEIFKKMKPKDICLGRLPNTNLQNSLKLLVEKPIIIKRLFEIKEINNKNVFALWLFVDKEWRMVILDNYFPINIETNNFAFCHSLKNELYISLIEKGLAKLKGNYTKICDNYNSIFITINELTGSIPDIKDFNLDNNIEFTFGELKNKSKSNDYLISCFKSQNFNSKKLKNIFPFKFFYIVDFKVITDKKGKLRKYVILRNSHEIEDYKSNFINDNQNRNEKFFEWFEFIEEFDNIAIWYIPTNNFHNSIKIQKNKSLVKLFVKKDSKFKINIYNDIYLNSEAIYGVNYFNFNENNNIYNSLLSKEVDYFKRCKFSLENLNNSKIRITLFKIEKNSFIQKYFEIIDNIYHNINIFLKNGDYYFLIENLNYKENKLNIITIDSNANNKFNFQQVNDIFCFDNSENKLWKNYLLKNSILEKEKKILFEMGNKTINYTLIELKDFEMIILMINSEFNEDIKIKLKVIEEKHCVFNNKKNNWITLFLKKNKITYYIVKINNDNKFDYKFKFKFFGFEKISSNSKYYKLIDKLNSITKKYDFKNCYYFKENINENGNCGCKVY